MINPNHKVLIVDDDEAIARALSLYLSKHHLHTWVATNAMEAVLDLKTVEPDVVLLDLRLPDVQGLELLRTIRERLPGAEVLIMSAYGTIELAIEAVKQGAFDFLTKPFTSLDVVLLKIEKAIKHQAVVKVLHSAQDALTAQIGIDDIIGCSAEMQEVFHTIKDVAYSDSTILIQGESGTGKELVAQSLHKHSRRSKNRFVSCNCAALAENLLESELFGHVKGSFTGAVADKQGLFQLAHKGTLLLDEIGEMPFQTQAKLLRVLQEGEIKRVGDERNCRVDVRILAATNRNLAELVAKGEFREDLFYRVNVITINLPPLRDRKEDIEPLIAAFVNKYSHRFAKRIEGYDDHFLQTMLDHQWPGNVRELENVVERAVVISKTNTLEVANLPEQLRQNANSDTATSAFGWKNPDRNLTYKQYKKRAVTALNRGYLCRLLQQTGGNITRAAEIAGMHRSNFKKLMRENQISADPYRDNPNSLTGN